MRRTVMSPEGLLGLLFMLALTVQACIVVVDDDAFDDFYDDHLHHSYWHLDIFVYHGRTYHVDDRAYTLSFDTRSRLSGAADCNDYDGDYETPRRGRLDVRDLVSTEAACAPSSLYSRFLDALAEARTYSLQDDRLTIASRDNKVVLYFVRD